MQTRGVYDAESYENTLAASKKHWAQQVEKARWGSHSPQTYSSEVEYFRVDR